MVDKWKVFIEKNGSIEVIMWSNERKYWLY
jgi:hypothetical protein